MPKQFYLFSQYSKKKWGCRLQKLTVACSFTCPNRDGTISYQGCSYCNNDSFAPTHMHGITIAQQLEHARQLSLKRYPKVNKYLAYFQNYSNSYAEIDLLKSYYDEALSLPYIQGLTIATRIDCISEQYLQLLKSYQDQGKVIILEYGLQSIFEDTLKIINRGHTYAQFLQGLSLTRDYGLDVCIHLILGLPLESAVRIITMAKEVGALPIQFIKLHHLQILRGTTLAKSYRPENCSLFSISTYVKAVSLFLSYLNPHIAIQRLFSEASPNYLIAPLWQKNLNINQRVEQYMAEHQLFQGKYFKLLNCS